VKRREALARLGVIGVASIAGARAQTRVLPVVGVLRSTPAAGFEHVVGALREGLAEAGLVDGRDVSIVQRWADNDLARLPALAAELGRVAAVIVANSQAAVAAKSAVPGVPLVFVSADDPVKRGLVDSFARPGGLVTGVTFFGGGQIGAKRFELLAEAVPRADVLGFLRDPSWGPGSIEAGEAQGVASRTGRRLLQATADHAGELGSAYESLVAQGVRAIIVGGSPEFTSARRALVDLAARHRIPAIYDQRDFPAIGGLMSYGGSLVGAYRQAGEYAARIVRGARPAELPVLQPTTFALVVNVATARDLKLELPRALILRADEVIG